MSEGASAGAASQGAAAGQAAGNAGSQASQASESAQGGEQSQAGESKGGDGEGAVATSQESTEASFEKAATQTIADPEEADDYKPVKDYIREKYKDEQFDDDEKVDRKAYEHIKNLETYQTKNRDANTRIVALFSEHPELIGTVRDMDEGADFSEALAINLSPEQRKTLRETILADDYKPQKETWQQKKTERDAKFTEQQKWTESYATNRKLSADNLKSFAEENKLDQPAMEDFAKYADGILADVYNGKVDKAFLNALHKARTADSQIAKAAEVAEVKGRNAAIAEKVTKAEPQGDGLPDLSKGGETKKVPQRSESEQVISDLIDLQNTRNNKFK